MKAKISTLSRKVEELEGKRLHEVQAVTKNPAQANPCIKCQYVGHLEEHCPIGLSVRDLMSEHANAVGQYKPQPNAHMEIHIIPIGRITLISLGSLTPLLMCLLVPNNSLVPHLNHNHHHHHPLLNKLF